MNKFQNFVCVFFLIFTFSCSKETFKDEKLSKLSSDKVMNRILELGFLKKDIVEFKEYYLVEDDIVFLKSDTVSDNLKQTRTYNSVTNSVIRVFLNTNFTTLNTNISIALDNAIASYNAVNSSLRFIRTTIQSEANITVSMDNGIGTDVCGLGGFPFADGRPFNSVRISETTLVKYGFTSNDQLRFLLVHELGHTIGLRHTNWSQPITGSPAEDANPYGAIQIPYTPTIDDNSVMNKATPVEFHGMILVTMIKLQYLRCFQLFHPGTTCKVHLIMQFL